MYLISFEDLYYSATVHRGATVSTFFVSKEQSLIIKGNIPAYMVIGIIATGRSVHIDS